MSGSLRFKVGDRVLACTYGAQWHEAVVTDSYCRTEDGSTAIYRMLSADGKMDLCTTVDSTDSVRAYVEPGLPRVVQAIQCRSSWADLKVILAVHSIDVRLVGSNLLLHAASSGCIDILIELILEYGVPESTCDKDGRNILHLALLHKQFGMVDLISKYYQKLLTKSDSKGFNAIHYVIMSKNTELLRKVLYNLKYFEEIDCSSVANLVDIHRLRYDNERLHQITNVITPLDWAKRMKQVEMVDILEKFMHELRMECLLKRIELYDEWNEENTFLQLTTISERMKEANLSVDPWQYTVIVGLVVSGIISGPANQIFPASAHRNLMQGVPTKLAEELSRVYYDWAVGDSLLEFTQVKLTEWIAWNEHLDNGDPWGEAVVDYLQAVVHRADTGVLVVERAEVLNYLLSHHSGVLLHPHKFVVQGQLHLLQWAVRAGHIDLKCHVSMCASLVEHVQSLSWLTLEIKRKNKPRGIPGDLTVAEVLCALAAGYGDYFIFQWLLEEVIPPARHGATFNHRDLLHIAAVQNHLLIVKYLLSRNPPRTLQMITSIDASFSANAIVSGQALLDYFTSEKPTLDLRTALMAVGARSTSEALLTYTNTEFMRDVCVALQQQMEAGAASDTLMQYFDEHFNLSRDLGWSLKTLGERFEHSSGLVVYDTTVYCTQIEEARSVEELLVCLLTHSIRAEKYGFFEHLINTLVKVLNNGMRDFIRMYRRSGESFAHLCGELPAYALKVGSSTELANKVATLCAALPNRLALKDRSVGMDRQIFVEMKTNFNEGAAVEVLEECLQRQLVFMESIATEERPHLKMFLPYLTATKFSDCETL
eukprot:gene16533-18862_t